MGLAGKDELHRVLRVGQQTKQPLRVVQQTGWAFCRSRKRRAKPSVNALGSNRCSASQIASGGAPEAVSCLDNRPRAYPTRDLVLAVRNCQSLASERRRMSRSRYSVDPSQRSLPQVLGPEVVGCGRVPAWHVNPLVTCPTGTSSAGQRGNRGSKRRRLTSRATGSRRSLPRSPDCQIGHVERLGRVSRVSGGPARVDRGALCRASPRHNEGGIAR